ncbi:MAG: polymerase alpha subunit, partial [Frankiales bacterium]|nr:polymerase alpha subunit [Frankiales bacterium]
MSDPFVHLHVASGYSLRHGASHPSALVERAADHGMDALALTDRDGMYGAVKFAQACTRAGIRPLFGVDLAVRPVAAPTEEPRASRPARQSPARGGAFTDRGPDGLSLPRVVLLARDGRGWAALCRLVSATHLAGERGQPVSSLELVAEHAGAAAQAGAVAVLLGPASEL